MENNELAHQLLCAHCVWYYGGHTVKVKIPTIKLLTSVEISDIMNKKTLIFWAAHSKKIGHPTSEYPSKVKYLALIC